MIRGKNTANLPQTLIFISFQPNDKANSQSLRNRLNVPHQFANI